jgi:5-methylcytosine-specific restriction endonuclease McrA
MQKFKAKLKNVPMDAPQVRSSTNPVLNRDESLSVQDKVLALNNLEVGQHQHKGGQGSRVPVIAYALNQRGRPLMPCSARKARVLIKKGEARVLKINPFFVIQLKKATGEQIQRCSIGIDTGYKNVGFSAITVKREIVAGALVLDPKTSERLTERGMYRRLRRRKLWYRQQRHNNRANVKKKGWISPSIQRRFDTQVKLIKKLQSLIPNDRLAIEVGNFDIQKIENPDIVGIQYRQGSMFGYQNMKSFLMAREHGKCQLCGKEFTKGNGPHIHHIISRAQGGTDRERDLALLHKKCHAKLHKNKLFHLLKKSKQYKDAIFMNIVQGRFREVFPDCCVTYGNETFVKRNELRLEKTHYNDAFVIAGGLSQIKTTPLLLEQKHKNSRVLQRNRKGFKPYIRRQRYSIQPKDVITVNGEKHTVKKCTTYGKCVICYSGKNEISFGIKKINKVFHVNSIYLKTL